MPENIKRDEKEVTPHDKKKKDVEPAKTEELDKSEQDNVAGGAYARQ
jgi:hypothetical protein